MTERKLFDREAALERVEGDLELYFELIDMFFDTSSTEIQGIEEALRSQDSKLVSSRAHAIKSAVGNLGAMTCFDLAFEIEKAGKAGDLSSIAALLARLTSEVEGFKREVSAFRAQNS